MKRPLAPLTSASVLLMTLNGAATVILSPSEKTVLERVARMDAVLCVRALSEPEVREEDWRPELQDADPVLTFLEPIIVPMIEQEVEVLEVIKGRSFAVPGMPIRIGTFGGNLDGDWRRRTLVVDATYVVFISQHPGLEQLQYDPHDLFRLDGPPISARYEAAYSRRLLGMSPSDALAFIRDAVANSQR